MIYSLTDKLNFNDNPVIKIKDKKIEVQADAELVDALQEKGEMQATLEAANILFTEKDKKIIKSLKLGFQDYMTLISTAISLALGEDPDKEENTQGEA